MAVDHFGNLISNIDAQTLAQVEPSGPKRRIRIRIGSHTIHGIDRTYQNGRSNTPLALIGSRGYLEIAVPKGNAAQLLQAGKGDVVRVKI